MRRTSEPLGTKALVQLKVERIAIKPGYARQVLRLADDSAAMFDVRASSNWSLARCDHDCRWEEWVDGAFDYCWTQVAVYRTIFN